MTEDDGQRRAIPLDGFQVAAVPGDGIWITDGDGNGWRVGLPTEGQREDNKLARAYVEATERRTE